MGNGRRCSSTTKKVAPPTAQNFTYGGTQKTGVLAGEGYTLSGTATAIAAGNYTAVATLQSGYVWNDGTSNAKTISRSISALGISGASVSVPTQTYTGSALTPVPTVTLNGKALVYGTDFTCEWTNNTDAGTGYVKVIGKGNYSVETGTVAFTISQKSMAGISASVSGSFVYNGSGHTPDPVVKDGTTQLVKDRDYTLSYNNNVNAGTASVTITGNKGFVKLLVLLVLVAAFVFTNELFGEQSVFNRSISENDFVNALYHKIPALIRSVQIVTVAWILSWLLQLVMRKGFARSNRAVTIVKLLESFIKWVIAIVAIMMVLHAWGVDTATLLASAGILTLIIGLGAESLVADILAGIFMVFEGKFQVGDIVIINDWRGTVQEIGIRTTKIVDAGGNINIVNNSEITTVINQTQEISQASVTVGIEYGESLPRVEIVIRDNLETIKEHIPAIIDGPYYKGVTALGASSVDLLFIAKCREEDIFQVQRDMNRELKLLFDANDIGIPFPQVVVNQPATFNARTTKRMETGARDFLEEQKEQSKGMEEEDL